MRAEDGIQVRAVPAAAVSDEIPGIDTVGVLTQYRPLALNSYIGTGQHWDLDRMNGGVFVLPPYATGEDGRWYSGTADAIWQNREFVDQYDPDYVLILSGDHIYKMDYDKMLECTMQAAALPRRS